MEITGEWVATVGQAIELVGAAWLFGGSLKVLRDPQAGRLGRLAQPNDVGRSFRHAVETVAKAGAGPGVVLIMIGLFIAVIGSGMQAAGFG